MQKEAVVDANSGDQSGSTLRQTEVHNILQQSS